MIKLKRIQLENRTDLKSEIPLEAPYMLFIDPSSACNFKCKFCMNGRIRKPEIMRMSLYESIIDSLHEFENPIKTIRFCGFGEPLLNTNICRMVRYAKQSPKVLNVDMTTNGSMLNPRLNCQLIESGIDRINISIEGMSSKQYRDFTGKDVNFNSIVRNIRHLYSIRRSTVIFAKINGDYLDDNEKKLFYDIFSKITDGCDIEHTMSCWYDIEVENANREVGIYGQPRENVSVCPYIFYSLMIHAGGEVSVCFLDWDKRMVIGDVNIQSIKTLWDSSVLKYFRFGMLRGIKNDICAKCDQLKAGMPVNLDAHADDILQRITND